MRATSASSTGTIIEHLRAVDEQTPYLRGIIASLGYRQIGVPYDRDARVAGQSKFGVMKLVELAIDAVTAQSTKPLRMVTVFGLGMSTLASLLILYYIALALFIEGGMPSGFTTIVLLLLFLIGFNAFILGLIGEYVGRIFNNTRSLPMTIVEHVIDARADDGSREGTDTAQARAADPVQAHSRDEDETP